MAGGMTPKRSGRTMAERTTASRPPRRIPRHCVVVDAPGYPGGWPGLLLEWRKDGAQWSGRAAFAARVGDEVVLVETWLAAEQLRPA